MKYRKLLEALSELTEEQLDMDVICCVDLGEIIYLHDTYLARELTDKRLDRLLKFFELSDVQPVLVDRANS